MAGPHVIDLASSPNSTQSKQPPPSHRLPTVAASQALQNLQNHGLNFVSTGLQQLDTLLGGGSSGSNDGGFARGKVTEIWGPIGAGKTALALQAARNSIDSGNATMWMDTTSPLSKSRLLSISSAAKQASPIFDERSKKFRCTAIPTLSHLLALILHPKPDLLPPDISMLVIDGLDVLVNLDYPRYQTNTSSKPEHQKWQAGRRYAVLGSVVSTLIKLAILHNMAVLVTTSCSTRMRADSGLGAALTPGIGGAEWDAGVWNRLVVFRDFSGRFVGVQKCHGKSIISREEIGEAGKLVSFEITSDGRLREQREDKPADGQLAAAPKPHAKPVKPLKRSFDEIADSEDEDVDEYGWIDADEHALVLETVPDQAHMAEPKVDVPQ